MTELDTLIREYDTLYTSLCNLYEIHQQSGGGGNKSENELLVEIEAKRKVISEKNKSIKELEEENGFLVKELERFEEMKKEFKKVNDFRDKEEEEKVQKMQEEILLLSQIKTDNSKTLGKMEKETEELRLVLAKLSGERSKETGEMREELAKTQKENERLGQMESGLKDKIRLLEDQAGLMKKQVNKMLKEKDKYHKKYNLMATLNKGHETRIQSVDKENKKLAEEKRKLKREVEEMKLSVKSLIQEVGSLGVKKEVLLDRLGHDKAITEQIEEADSLDDSLNDTMNQDLREIELDFENSPGLQELNTHEREHLQIDETFEKEIQREEAQMKAATGFGTNFMDEESELDLTSDFMNITIKKEPSLEFGKTEKVLENRLSEADFRSPNGATAKMLDKEDEEELQKIYDKVSGSGSQRGQSRRPNRVKGSLRSINKEQAQRDFEQELDAKIKRRQEEGMSRIYASQFRSTVYESNRPKNLLVSTLATTTPVHKSTFEFGVESRKLEMNLLKKTKETIGELCKSMNQDWFQGNEMKKLEKGIHRIKKVDDLVEWVFVYFTKKLTKMEGQVKSLRTDHCRANQPCWSTSSRRRRRRWPSS